MREKKKLSDHLHVGVHSIQFNADSRGAKMKYVKILLTVFAIGFSADIKAETTTRGDAEIAMNRQTTMMFSRDNSEQTTLKGAVDCEKWLYRKNAPLVLYYEGWVLGFLNGMAGGMALYEGANFMKDSDPKTIMLLMDRYCSNHRLKNTGDGALRVAFQLLAKKR